MKPWLWLPAQISHDLASAGLALAAKIFDEVPAQVRPFHWYRKSARIECRNPLGIAGGVDKDGDQIEGWRHFGAGFVEVGTVTPRQQSPNPGKIMARETDRHALWNKMGFPSRGSQSVRLQIRDWRIIETTREAPRFPVFLNIGKQRETALSDAHRDYIELIEYFMEPSKFVDGRPLVDAFVVNISSPNTTGLRELFSHERLQSFLTPIAETLDRYDAVGLLKLSPDMDDETLKSACDVAVRLNIDGFVATNTTAARPAGFQDLPEQGGLSGSPLTIRSREFLTHLIDELGPRRSGRLIVSAGGVLDGREARTRLELGADLVQTYSGLVFQGPSFFREALHDLA